MCYHSSYRPVPEIVQKRLENTGEAHLGAGIILDVSGSMASSLSELRQGLNDLKQELMENSHARGRVELAIETFSDTAQLLVPFGPLYDIVELPRLDIGGTTALHTAIDLMLNQVEKRKEVYEKAKCSYYRPIVLLLTDGKATDRDNGTLKRLRRAQLEKKVHFFVVGIGNAIDREYLRTLNIDGIVLTASRETFRGIFQWLSKSLITMSKTDTTEGISVTLPNPTEYQLTLELI